MKPFLKAVFINGPNERIIDLINEWRMANTPAEYETYGLVPERIESLYRTMADALGPTGWWPADSRLWWARC